MLISILKVGCWVGYGICGVLLLSYLVGYLKIKKEVDHEKRDDK